MLPLGKQNVPTRTLIPSLTIYLLTETEMDWASLLIFPNCLFCKIGMMI